VKIANKEGVEKAMQATPAEPFSREYLEINAGLRKLLKKFKQLELEGIETEDFPEETRKLLSELQIATAGGAEYKEITRFQAKPKDYVL
jgi:hypothetical protein